MIPDFLTIAETARFIQKREISPVELVESRLKRIEKIDKQLNSFIHVAAEEALMAAKNAEAEIMAGNYKGCLHGIPLGLKDIFETAGIPTTAHSKILQNHTPTTDAHSVKRLKQAGAIIIGKQATHEFAFGGPSFDLPWPPARNPWNIDCFTGGSSSGSAAAVAGGLVLGSMAGDTGGSIRTPAAYCGLTGLKPTYGLISRSGILPLAFSLDHAGPIAWTAEDCALLLQAMVGHDPSDPTSVNCSIPNYHANLTSNVKGLRIGWIRHFYTDDNKANTATINAIDVAAKKFEEMGCIVKETKLSPLSEWAACGMIILLAEAYSIHEKNLQTRFTDYGEIFRDRMALAASITAADYIQATRRRRELIDEFDQAMNDVDVLLTATTTREAPKINAVSKFSVFEKPLLTIPFNVTGSPAITVCCGYAENGLPLAMQIAGKRFDDATVLRVADAYEQATSWHDRKPIF